MGLLYLLFIILGGMTALCSLIVFIIKAVLMLLKKRNFVANKLIFIFFVSCLFLSLGIYNLFFNLQAVPRGDLLRSTFSPDGRYMVKTYVCDDDPLSANTARGELIDTKRHTKKTIYWNYYDNNPYVEWLTPTVVVIGNQTLHVGQNEVYDWRQDDTWARELPKQFLEKTNSK
ncbi:hypothetical protein DFP93_10571 [Aneurinibacillus soli]|uniref:Uncharacterized protein n=1 Tax=Aneurinibacillus soli TaxID=1500254 RepID=A0A0U5BAM8_9BACL|nr:DUF5412 family protein [Aneurinibacillus soli]PYE62118.1 hypothetical protein DFP93_10571 [Aneurinibacillus soli]BAU28694.1 hypothetical protein CB4_02869 [Aneurinibacillus soli]